MPDTGRNAIACRNAVLTLIQGIAELEPIGSDRMVARRRPFSKRQMYTGVTAWIVPEKTAPSMVRTESIGYGVCLTLCLQNSDSDADRDILTPFREIIRRATIWQQLNPTLEDNCTFCTVTFEHDEPLNLPKFAEEYEISQIIVRCWVDEVRQ